MLVIKVVLEGLLLGFLLYLVCAIGIRNGAVAPWLNRINARVAQDVYFNLAGKKQTVEISLDVKNVANLLNSDWGLSKQMTSNTILSYKNNEYTFTKPEWKNYNSLLSTWQMLLSARWSF